MADLGTATRALRRSPGFTREIGVRTDPLTFAGGSWLLLLVGAGAVLVPSVRAARLEPMIALRSD